MTAIIKAGWHKYLLAVPLLILSAACYSHGVDQGTKLFLLNNEGQQLLPFLYIGAKHMVTGYDHLLFLTAVIFFLYRLKDILLYVSVFTLGHSLTLLFGVLADIQINAFLIDAVIGLSVVYKGFDNLGGLKKCFGRSPSPKLMVLIFGLCHGFGLATKLQELQLDSDSLLGNLLAFNVGVELGQFMALALILVVISGWRRRPSFKQFAGVSNILIMAAGFSLIIFQLAGYFSAAG